MRRLVVLLLLALVLAVPAVANAQTPPAETAPMDVQVWMGAEPGQLLVIVGTTLPANTKLPTTVRIPILDGFEVLWAGEIAGSQQGDIKKTPTIKQGVGGRYAEFEITTTRQAQVELGSVVMSQTAEGFSANVDFVQAVPIDSTSFSVRVPAQVNSVRISPAPTGQPARNESGEALYTLPTKELKAGQKQTVTVTYKTGAAVEPGQAADPVSASSIVSILLALVAVAVVALVVVMGRQRRSVAVQAEDSHEQGEEDEL